MKLIDEKHLNIEKLESFYITNNKYVILTMKSYIHKIFNHISLNIKQNV